MFEEFDSANKEDKQQAFDLLQELERNTTDEIRRKRAHFRLALKAAVVMTPGNASEMHRIKVQGVSGDISEGGCSVLFPIPAHVGDIYRLSFDKKTINIPMTIARCVRCRLIREDAYEAGFAFFKPITLPDNIAATQGAANA